MTEQTKTHWKKNIDQNYISGEDLNSEIKGLKKEMLVEIFKQSDSESFDQKQNKKKTVTSIFLREIGGKELFKPTILNKTNAKFFINEFGSEYMEDWIGKPCLIFAQPDIRHGHVVRFKHYEAPELIIDSDIFKKAKAAIEKGFPLSDMKKRFKISKEVEAKLIAKA